MFIISINYTFIPARIYSKRIFEYLRLADNDACLLSYRNIEMVGIREILLHILIPIDRLDT